MSIDVLNLKRKKNFPFRTKAYTPLAPAMTVDSWIQALNACLPDWPQQKPQWLALWQAPPDIVSKQSALSWQKAVEACLEQAPDLAQAERLKALLKPVNYELELIWKSKEASWEVLLNGRPIVLELPDFEYLYALADLQSRSPEGLQDHKQLYQHVQTLFDKQEPQRFAEKPFRQAFTVLLDKILGTLDLQADQQSSQRWRHLLISQAMRYASGFDDAEHFAFHSELRQHRDLLELLITRYEQQEGLPPLASPAARLYRFFVTDPEALEIKYRLSDHVSKHMYRLHQQLQKQQIDLQSVGCPQEILWGDLGVLPWQDATRDGYSFHSAVNIRFAKHQAGV